MSDTSYRLVVKQEPRNVVVQTPGPKGVQGNTGSGVSSVTVTGNSGNTGAMAGAAGFTLSGDGNAITTAVSGTTVTITDSGIRSLTVSGDSGSTSAITGAGALTVNTGAGLTSSATGTTVTVTHDAPGTGLSAQAFVESITLDALGHVKAVAVSADAAAFRTTAGANNAANLNAGSIANARVPAAAVTQHQAALALGGAQITSGTVAAARVDNLDTAKITTGTLANARVAASNVTQHAGSINIADLGNVVTSLTTNNAVLRYNSTASQWQSAAFGIDIDLSPQLGGNLDINGHDIVSTSNANIDITPNGTGKVMLDTHVEVTSGLVEVKNAGAQSQVRLYDENSNSNYVGLKAPPNSVLTSNVTFTLPSADGTNRQVLQTDGSGNLSFANQTGDNDWKFDPTNTGQTSIFDDFMGSDGSSPMPRFLGLATATGGNWNSALAPDTMGVADTDSYGVCEAETSTATAARVIMNLPRLMRNSPSNGDEWLWEVRVRPTLATGDGYFMFGAVQPNGAGVLDHNDQIGVTGADDNPRAWIYADKDNTYWKSGVSNATGSVTITAADTAQAYADNTFVRLALHCKYDSAGNEYDLTFYVNGVSRYTTSLSAGQGSPYGRIELANNGTGTQQRAMFDWSMIQYTRHAVPNYITLASI